MNFDSFEQAGKFVLGRPVPRDRCAGLIAALRLWTETFLTPSAAQAEAKSKTSGETNKKMNRK